MPNTLKKILKEIGTLSSSILIAFFLFMGIMIARGVTFTEPPQAPPNGNAYPPINATDNTVTTDQQTIYGKLVLWDLFAFNMPRADGNGLGEWLSNYASGRKRYQAVAIMKNAGVPLDMNAMNTLCKDDDGCKVTLSLHDYDENLVTGRPGMMQSKWPFVFSLSQTSNWWKTSPQGPNPDLGAIGKYYKPITGMADCLANPGPNDKTCVTANPYAPPMSSGVFGGIVESGFSRYDLNSLFFGTEGKDNNGVIETVTQLYDCLVTDGEYPATPGDTQLSFSLYMNATTYATQPTWCLLDIED